MTDEVEVAVHAARAAAAIARQGLPRTVAHKGAVDLVTEIDLRCEEAIRKALERRAPGVPVLGEEGGGAAEAPTRWVVDPIDGTTNLVHGYPFVCTSIALEVDRELVAACVIDVVRGVEYTAAARRGARADSRPMRVGRCDALDRALVGTGFAYDRRERTAFYLARLGAVMARCQGIRRAGAAALELALLADGRLDAFWEYRLKWWDVAAGALLIREAGGAVTAIDGAPLRPGTPDGPLSVDVLAGNPALHAQLGAVLAGVGGDG